MHTHTHTQLVLHTLCAHMQTSMDITRALRDESEPSHFRAMNPAREKDREREGETEGERERDEDKEHEQKTR